MSWDHRIAANRKSKTKNQKSLKGYRMRYLAGVLGVGAMVLFSGCADSKWSLFRHSQDTVRLPTERPTATQLVAYVNNNAQRIGSLECPNLDLDCKQGIQGFHIRGKLACQKPKDFRMHAEALGTTEADIGSNDQEFWYWIRRGDPYLIHCSYQDLASGVRIPFPFQPEWVMEALGMSEYDPTQPPELVTADKTYQLVQRTKNSQGQPVQKVTVFNRQEARFQVTDHILYDANRKEICRAHIVDAAPVQGAVLPRRIVFTYPSERLTLDMTLWHQGDDVAVNRGFDPARAKVLFARPALSGVQNYDLARGPEGPNQVKQAGITDALPGASAIRR
jgi:hypothetical protein